MGRKKVNICKETGVEIIDRTYNKKAQYSKEGIKIHRKAYLQEYKRMHYAAQKLVGIGIVTMPKGEDYGNRNIVSMGQKTI